MKWSVHPKGPAVLTVKIWLEVVNLQPFLALSLFERSISQVLLVYIHCLIYPLYFFHLPGRFYSNVDSPMAFIHFLFLLLKKLLEYYFVQISFCSKTFSEL